MLCSYCKVLLKSFSTYLQNLYVQVFQEDHWIQDHLVTLWTQLHRDSQNQDRHWHRDDLWTLGSQENLYLQSPQNQGPPVEKELENLEMFKNVDVNVWKLY